MPLSSLAASIAAVGIIAPAPVLPSPARQIVENSIAAMGGRENLLALHRLTLDLRVVSKRIDDSERAEGPYWINVLDGREWRDEDGGRYRAEFTDASAQWTVSTARVDDGRILADGTLWQGKWQWGAKLSLGDRAAFSPERLLLTAATASDLKVLPEAKLWRTPQSVVGFTWHGMPVRLFIDQNLHLPSRLEVVRGNPLERVDTMLGDATYATDFSFYRPEGRILYPRQWTTSRDGHELTTTIVTRFEANAGADADFSIPVGAATDPTTLAMPFADRPIPVPQGNDPLVADKPGVWMIAGSWNVLVVQQSDGLVVIECPQSGGYSQKIMALLAARFPGVPVKALITTTDSLWHIAGVRPYVAAGVPIYALGLNLPSLRALIDNPRRLDPDDLSAHPHAALLRPVSGRTVIGDGVNRIVLYPIAGRADERMLMAYFPALNLLYGSSNDVSAELRRPTFNAFEIVARVRALNLSVADYVAMHTSLMPWTEFETIVSERPIISE